MGFFPRLERRDHPSSPTETLLRAWGYRETNAGVSVTPQSALYLSGYFACVRILSQAVASLSLHTMRRLPGGGKDRARDHRNYRLLHDRPNPEMSAYTWLEVAQSHLNTWGNCYSQKIRDGAGQVVALWPLRPDRMRVDRHPRTREVRYRYQPDQGPEETLYREDVLHISGLGFDGLMGYSPATLAREQIGLGLAAEEFGARFFANDASSGLALSTEHVLSDVAYQRLQDSWVERGGLKNAHRPRLLEQGLKVEHIGIPPEDAQFMELRRFQVAEVSRMFGIPLFMLGETEKSTSWGTGIEQQMIGFVVHVLRPWLRRWEEVLSWELFFEDERTEYFVEFDLNSLLRGDIKTRALAYAIFKQNGIYTTNELRGFEGANPIEGGDTLWAPKNMQDALAMASVNGDGGGGDE